MMTEKDIAAMERRSIAADAVAAPNQSAADATAGAGGAVSCGQREAFARDGFLVLPGVVDAAALADVRDAFTRRVADLMRRCGVAPRGGFADNLVALLHKTPAAYQHIDISLPMVANMRGEVAGWRQIFGDRWQDEAGVFADESVYRLITHANIAAVAHAFVGEDIIASPVQHVRIKPPQRLLPGASRADANTARTLWHQDEAVVSEAARGVNILTVWIALTDATIQNGCMEAVAGSHLRADETRAPDFGLTAHCPGKGDMVGEIYIPEARIDKSRVVPLVACAGDVVLLHKRAVHGAGANASADVRWSFDLRYQPAGTPTGRDFFPACRVDGAGADAGGAAAYRHSWFRARDAIIRGDVAAVFNNRWNKYGGGALCA